VILFDSFVKRVFNMKYILLTIGLILAVINISNAQIFKNKEKSGKIHFFSTTPMENIEAKSIAATSLLNTSDDSIRVNIPITSFEFKNSLIPKFVLFVVENEALIYIY
jgi:hypothetical protein